MSTKKEKLIEEAQRFALRGQLDKAIASYRQLLSMEPSAINHRQRLADILVKIGKIEEARGEFETIGKHYASNGFYLKAIAVYKQVQKLFPADISLNITVAGLNEKHGLTANALAEYKQVSDYYEKNGQTAEVLKIIEKMQGVDPSNINIKLKLAEAYFQAGKLDDSYRVFGKLASLLQERGENASFQKLNDRIQKLFPQKSSFMLEVLEEQITSGQAANAVAGLQTMLRTNPNDKRIWDLVVAAYTALKQPQKLKMAYTHYLKFFPDQTSAQSGLISSLAAEGDLQGALGLLDRYEQGLLAAGNWQDLSEIYRSLETLDPINLKVLEGLERAYTAGGKSEEVAALASKIKSLKSLGDESTSLASCQDNSDEQASAFAISDSSELFQQVSNSESNAFLEPVDAESELLKPETTPPDVALEEEIEIDIDFDDVSGFADDPVKPQDAVIPDNWLDSVGELFDSIETSPRGVKFGNAVENVDCQSHYDLGLAFKEMGLFDEAINELRQASADHSMKISCLVLQSACLREKGDLPKAEKLLRKLMQPGLSLKDSSSVKYELALTCAAAGNQEESSTLLAEIESTNPGFRDVKTLLDSASNDEGSLDFSDDELQGFDLK